jgi:hypothetical protein
MNRIARIAVISAVLATAIITAAPGVSVAKKTNDYIQVMKMEFAHIQGEVTGKSPEGDYLIVSDRKVYLVEATSAHGKKLATAFYNPRGDVITFGDVKVGDQVYVNAGALRDNDVAAKDVFVIDGKMTDSQMRRFSHDKKMKSWRKEVESKN